MPTGLDADRLDAGRPTSRRVREPAAELPGHAAEVPPRAWATWAMIATNVAVYLAMVVGGDNGLTAQGPRLAAWGGNFGPLTRSGEWWRLLTATFLHAGLPHLLLNMVALRSGGPLLERLLGHSRYLGLYLLAGIGASLASVTLTSRGAVSIGASGAVFGVYGALLGLALRHVGAHGAVLGLVSPPTGTERPRPAPPSEILGLGAGSAARATETEATADPDGDHEAREAEPMPAHVWRRLAAEILVLFALNVLIGVSLPGIDNAAHVTGFALGLLLGSLAYSRALHVAIERADTGGAGAPVGRDASRWLLPAAGAAMLVLGASAVFPLLPPGGRASVLDAACRARVGSACVAAGQQALRLPGTGRPEALAYFSHACEVGSADGCVRLGVAHLAGGDEGRSPALQAFTKACEAGHAAGCNGLAALYESGTGVTRDLTRAAQLYAQACDRGDGPGCARLSEAYAGGRGVRQDASRAAALASKACDAGEARGCTQYAAALAAGSGAAQDTGRAIELYRRACDNVPPEPRACAELGVRHVTGDGVPHDLALAAHHYLALACSGGHGPSCTRAGRLFEGSTELGVNLPRAAALYQRGCTVGDAAACFHLGVMYADGRGLDRDPARALSLYDEACRRGMRQACGLAAWLRALQG